ncbi:PA2169 family four-helix-bundle protein [Dyella jejuensis]|uniref:PA2169 family four-helix-bundle protein n=1 Tax=Dyella jejuensis TaxID=1432009 RepID=A0ABW8JGV5_9GAMM
MRDPAHDIDVLNDLIEITMDSYEGYREAAEHLENTEVAALFSRWALNRRHVLCELRHAVQNLGGRPVAEGTVLGSARRFFVDLRTHLTANHDAVVEEAERSDEHLKHQFESALNDYRLSTPVRDAVEHAYLSVKTCHGIVHELKQPCPSHPRCAR